MVLFSGIGYFKYITSAFSHQKAEKMRKEAAASRSVPAFTFHSPPGKGRPGKPGSPYWNQPYPGTYLEAVPQPKSSGIQDRHTLGSRSLPEPCWITRSASCFPSHGVHREKVEETTMLTLIRNDPANKQESKQGMKTLMLQVMERRC